MTDKDPLHAPEEATMTSAPPPPIADEDSDPDFDDLDDVLDQFSASAGTAPVTAKAPSEPTPSASGPGRPNLDAEPTTSKPPNGSKPEPSEEEFLAHLNAEMSALISNMSSDPAASNTSAADLGAMGKELEEFTEKMEREGVKPEDLLRAILGEEAGESVIAAAKDEKHKIEREEDRMDAKAGKSTSTTSKSTKKDLAADAASSATTFEDTIRRTMERMSTSDATARDAATQSASSEEDMLAQLLRAMESGGGGIGGAADGEDGDLSKMFLGMMEQLTNKEMLYEPMKELDTKFPDWLRKNGDKLSADEKTRYENQRRIVGEIVGKFEERGYSDEDSRCREFIWERMQKMQAEGSPPEDLIANPFPGMGMPGLGGGGEGGEDAQCPTQ